MYSIYVLKRNKRLEEKEKMKIHETDQHWSKSKRDARLTTVRRRSLIWQDLSRLTERRIGRVFVC